MGNISSLLFDTGICSVYSQDKFCIENKIINEWLLVYDQKLLHVCLWFVFFPPYSVLIILMYCQSGFTILILFIYMQKLNVKVLKPAFISVFQFP